MWLQPSTMADEQPQGQDHLNDFGKIAFQFVKYGQNATNNIAQVFNDMTPKEWIRLVAIVGAYLLIRPYVLKHATKKNVERMEKESKEREEQAKISPNELRGGKKAIDGDDSDDEGESSTTDWGAKARTRQRTLIKRLMKAEEERKQELQDDEDDRDIADLLED